jgi:phage recombination protein Bet
MAETEVKPEPGSPDAPDVNGGEPAVEVPTSRLAVARLAHTSVPLTQPARFSFDNEQLALMKRTVARGADDNAFLLFLELVGRYGLDPFAKQVYLAKMPGKDGEAPIWTTIVARDGLLAIANRHDDYGGMEGDVIYATDIIARTTDGFVHTYPEIAAAERLKGDIVGAWARVFREGRVPTFFLAKFASYKTGNKTWSKYPDAMILKVAESMSLRKAFSITGLVPEDEVGAHYDERYGGVVEARPSDQEPDWGPDADLAKRLQIAFDEANRIRPGSFLPQKVRLKLAGADQTKRTEILQEVTDFVLANGGSIPIDAEVEEEGAAEEASVDAPQAV